MKIQEIFLRIFFFFPFSIVFKRINTVCKTKERVRVRGRVGERERESREARTARANLTRNCVHRTTHSHRAQTNKQINEEKNCAHSKKIPPIVAMYTNIQCFPVCNIIINHVIGL